VNLTPLDRQAYEEPESFMKRLLSVATNVAEISVFAAAAAALAVGLLALK
jgi:hypothetical protein